MTDEKVEAPKPQPVPRFRQALKCLGWTLLILLGLLILFHRPIFFHGTRYFAIRVAKKQNLDLNYKLSGTIFTTLWVENLRATPTGPGPLEHLSIQSLELEYSLIGFLRKGLPGLLDRMEVRNARIELTPAKSTQKKKGPRKAFKFPAVFPGRLQIENLHLISHGPKGDLVLDDLNLDLDPERPGQFSVKKLAIPGFRTWENLEAPTTYRERNLRMEELQLDESVEIGLLSLDASELNQGVLGLNLRASLFGGSAEINSTIQDLNATNVTKLEARLLGLPLERAAKYFKVKVPVSGQLRQAYIQFDGPLKEPRKWSGTADLELLNAVASGIALQQVALQAKATKGDADLQLEVKIDPTNELTVLAQAALADSLDLISRSRVTGTIDLNLRSLGTLPVKNLPVHSGSAQAKMPFQLEDKVLKAQVKARLSTFEGFRASLSDANLTLTLEKPLPSRSDQPPINFYDGLIFQGDLQATDMVAAGYRGENVAATFSVRNRKVTLTSLEVTTGQNRIAVAGDYFLPERGERPAAMPTHWAADIAAPALAEFSVGAEPKLEGGLEARINLSHEQSWNGTIEARSGGLKWKGVTLASLDVNGVVEEGVAKFDRLNARFDAENFIEGQASVGLEKPFAFDADLTVNLDDLSYFRPLLPVKDGERPPLAGAVKLNWKGAGSLADLQNEGDLQLTVKNATFGQTRDIDASIAGHLSPGRIEIPNLTFSSSVGRVRTDVLIAEKSLHLDNLQITLPEGAAIAGSAVLPLNLEKEGGKTNLFPSDGPFKLNLTGQNIRLEPFLTKGEKPPPVSGRVDLVATADGTLDMPHLQITSKATGLIFAAASDLAPARLDTTVTLDDDRIRLVAHFYMQGLSPVTVEAGYPFSVPEILAKKQLDRNAPIEGRIELPVSPLDFAARLSGQIRRADGRVAIDARLAGTIDQPTVSGSARMRLTSLRFSNQNIPPIADFNADIAFTEDQVRFEQFSGSLAGGPFSLKGQIGLQPLTDPAIDLRLEAKNALLTRNETVTVRANADVSVKGTLKAAEVTGNVALTNSRFFREIDILPLQLPGRPAPKPPARASTVVRLPPFLADWKFDLKIETADPFLIRGNLASGNVNLDMKFLGTGKDPALDGYAYLDKFVASLPFSQLEIVSGYAYFTPDNPFVPVLDLYGSSEIRNYTVSVYIYGEASNPETLFSSEPPLPQEDIISLLATGTTTEELTGDSSVAAGRAAAILLQKISRTFFKQKEPPPPGSFLDRFDLDVGTVDPRTGNQEIQAGFQLTDHFLLIGDLDVQGQLSGQVKYLIRFR